MAVDGTVAGLASLVAPLPPAPEGEVFTQEQWDILLSICEVFIPAIESSNSNKASFKYLPEGANEDTISAYLSEAVSSLPTFKPALHRKLGHYVPASGLAPLATILSMLNTRLGSLALTGYSAPISSQPLSIRTSIVRSWSNSYLPPLRALFRSLSALTISIWVNLSPTLPQMVSFPSVPKHIERNPSFEFTFHQFEASSTPTELSTDVVIVGSGCGAGVCASRLSAADYKVLVLEKSYHFPSSHFPMSAEAAGEHMMENGFAVVSDDNSIAVLAGSTWGGGGTVNWSASLQPQHYVREEWAKEGLDFASGKEFQSCLDSVCETMGVCKMTDHEGLEKIEHNFANRTLIEGARRLGMAAETVPQNTGGDKHFCGYCSAGCSSATKKGPANKWLPDAAAHGAEFIEGFWAEKVLFDDGEEGEKVATGVKGIWTSRDRSITRDVVIKAKKVIVSGGTLQSPLLLLRSGITNPNVGRNLHLHPVSAIASVFPNEVRPWEGPILTSAVTSLENHDGLGHGPKLEVIASTPCFLLPFMPWRTLPSNTNPALDFKTILAKFHHMTGFISLQRDRDTGQVFPDPQDPRRVRIKYTLSPRDAAGILEGVIAASRIAYTMDAVEIHSIHAKIPPWVREEPPNDPMDQKSFNAWLDLVRKTGISSPDPCYVGSAHQMGTCRMAADPRNGVVDSNGRVWGTSGFYVADASVFPSASAVNPMITTMALAEWICRGILGER
jgi:choline dehydrogenase-like flavoprotein